MNIWVEMLRVSGMQQKGWARDTSSEVTFLPSERQMLDLEHGPVSDMEQLWQLFSFLLWGTFALQEARQKGPMETENLVLFQHSLT